MQSFFRKMFGVKVEYFQYRCVYMEQVRINGLLTAKPVNCELTNHSNAVTQVLERRRNFHTAWLEDENGCIVKGI